MRKHNSAQSSAIAPLPHSWSVDDWPGTVFPNEAGRARWIVRAYRSELIAEGAIGRLGKKLLILGAGYNRFLTKRVARVQDFESNNPSMRSQDAA